jgi:hypothetical protein
MLVLRICYRLPEGEPSTFGVSGNVKEELRRSVLEDFLRTQVGAGEDRRPAEDREEYNIRIEVDLSDDTFSVWHDCGNKGLMAGIVMDVVSRMEDE